MNGKGNGSSAERIPARHIPEFKKQFPEIQCKLK
jgi:hypothetical protein